jgi:hypothetical protein
MARKRRSYKIKPSVQRVYVQAKKKVRRYKRTGGFKSIIQPEAMIYGGVRERVSNFLSGYVSNIPLVAQIPAGLADEVTMAIINYYGAKKLKGLPQKVAMKGLVIENARVGEAIANNLIPQSSNANTNSNNMW